MFTILIIQTNILGQSVIFVIKMQIYRDGESKTKTCRYRRRKKTITSEEKAFDSSSSFV